jgi:hypothetical protein
LDAEIGVDADQSERHQERRPQQRENLAHDLGSLAASSALTLKSNSAR